MDPLEFVALSHDDGDEMTMMIIRTSEVTLALLLLLLL
jgi:hypothetical protein